jgi:hypothetical protein
VGASVRMIYDCYIGMRMEVSVHVLIELIDVNFVRKGRKNTCQPFECLPKEAKEFRRRQLCDSRLEPYGYAKEMVSISLSFLCITIVR